MTPIQIISQDLFDKVRSRFQNLEMGDSTGAVTIDPTEAVFFDFDFVAEGNNLGRVSISLGDLGSLKVYYSQGITENNDEPVKKAWFAFLKEMRFFAMRRLLRFDTRDIAKTNLDKNDFQHLAKTQAPKEEPTMNMNETKKTRKGVSENAGRELTNTPRDRLISRMSPSIDNTALMQKVGKVVNSPEFNSDTILKIVDAGDSITHPVGRYIQKEFDELQYDLGSAYEDYPEEVAEKLLSMLKARTQQHLGESRWNGKSSKKTSRATSGRTEVIVRHKNDFQETYAGSRSHPKHIKSIFIQNADGERFKYPFIHTAGAFAMAQHVDHGGVPHDPAGKAIMKMSEEIAKLGEFQKKVRSATLHDDATGITERAIGRMNELKAQIAALGKRQHYESWINEFHGGIDDSDMMLDDVTMEQYKQKFTQTSFEESLTDFFPLLHKIMSETNAVDLEDYVGESKDDNDICPDCGESHDGACPEDDGKIKKEAFDIGMGQASHGRNGPEAEFQEWADATESGELTQDQIQTLKSAIEELPDGKLQLGPNGQTAIEFFNELVELHPDLAEKFQDQSRINPEADPIKDVLTPWAEENYPNLVTSLGLGGTEQEPTEAPPEKPTAENEEMDGPANKTMPTREAVVKEVAKLVKSRFNEDNPEVGPFNGAPNIALDVKKKCAEMFGDEVGAQAEGLALEFMEKLTKKWEAQHGPVEDDGLSRLKELLGNVKAKVEGIGDRGNGGTDFNTNIMPANENISDILKLSGLAK